MGESSRASFRSSWCHVYTPLPLRRAAMNRLTFFVLPSCSSINGLSSSSCVGWKPPCCWMNLFLALWYSVWISRLNVRGSNSSGALGSDMVAEGSCSTTVVASVRPAGPEGTTCGSGMGGVGRMCGCGPFPALLLLGLDTFGGSDGTLGALCSVPERSMIVSEMVGAHLAAVRGAGGT